MDLNNLDDMKRQWQDANAPLDSMTDETLRLGRRALLRRGSAQEKLAAQYRRMIVLAAVALLMWITMVFAGDIVLPQWRVAVVAGAALFFITAGGIDLYLLCAVRRIDIASWPVNDVAVEGRRLLRCHKLSVLLLLPMALALITLFVFTLDATGDERRWLLYGITVGAVIGLSVGVVILLRFLRLYRSLSDDFDTPPHH